MVIPPQLMLYCTLATLGYLLVVTQALNIFERRLIAQGHLRAPETDGKPSSMTKIWDFVTQWIFYAGLPMGLYSWLYLLLPLEGPRAGIAIALWTIVIGTLPFAMQVSEKHNTPFIALVFLMFSQVVKLLGILAIIGLLFSL